jgi:hypothetical protein
MGADVEFFQRTFAVRQKSHLLCDINSVICVLGRALPTEGLFICKDGDQNDRYEAGH